MLAQRPAFAAAAAAANGGSSRPTARPTPAVASRPRRLSFSEQRALETLPGRIESLQARVAVLNNELVHPGLYDRDPDGFATMTAALATVHEELTAAEDQWLALEIRREEIDSARTSGRAHFADETPRG
jgi:ATP-binding cassette subfamily F protein uup